MMTPESDDALGRDRGGGRPGDGGDDDEKDVTAKEVDPMAPGRTLVDPDLDEAVEPNEPA